MSQLRVSRHKETEILRADVTLLYALIWALVPDLKPNRIEGKKLPDNASQHINVHPGSPPSAAASSFQLGHRGPVLVHAGTPGPKPTPDTIGAAEFFPHPAPMGLYQ